jgi:hypothetical protein
MFQRNQLSTQEMEGTDSSEMLVPVYKNTQHHIPVVVTDIRTSDLNFNSFCPDYTVCLLAVS